MAERVLIPDDEKDFIEGMVYGGVELPRYLATREAYNKRMAKVREIMEAVKADLKEGTPSGDAGDTHGQYHNELAWYREQDIQRRSELASRIGVGLDKAVLAEDYDQIRSAIGEVGVNPTEMVTVGSKLVIEYNDDSDDKEEIMLVTPLDGTMNEGWVSIETPLAKAIEGASKGDRRQFKVRDHEVSVRIVKLS